MVPESTSALRRRSPRSTSGRTRDTRSRGRWLSRSCSRRSRMSRARSESQVAGGGDDAHVCVAFATVVFRPEAAPVRERLCPLLRGRVEEAVDPVAIAEKGHRRRTGVGLDRSPSRRVRRASRRPRLRAMFQPAGGEAGCSQANGPEARRWLDSPPPPHAYDQHHRGPATATRPSVARVRGHALDAAVAVVRAPVLVGVTIAAAVRGSPGPVPVRLSSRRWRRAAWRWGGRWRLRGGRRRCERPPGRPASPPETPRTSCRRTPSGPPPCRRPPCVLDEA